MKVNKLSKEMFNMENMNEFNEMALLPIEEVTTSKSMTGTTGFLSGIAVAAAGVGIWALVKKIRKDKIQKQAEKIFEKAWTEKENKEV
jgi:hypothetical protein